MNTSQILDVGCGNAKASRNRQQNAALLAAKPDAHP